MKKITKSIVLGLAFSAASLCCSYGEGAVAEVAVEEKAGKDTADSLTDEMVAQFNTLTEAIAAAKDKASAEASAVKINKVGDDIAAIAERMSKVDKPTAEEQTALTEKMTAASADMQTKMQEAMVGIMQNQEAAAIIMPAMMEFGKKMAENGDVLSKIGSGE